MRRALLSTMKGLDLKDKNISGRLDELQNCSQRLKPSPKTVAALQQP
jgi:hypothetical protein